MVGTFTDGCLENHTSSSTISVNVRLNAMALWRNLIIIIIIIMIIIILIAVIIIYYYSDDNIYCQIYV